MANIILYFGSFNPVHNGHTAVAAYVLGEKLCDELWLVVSPGNPLKKSAELAPGGDRLAMVRIAAAEQLKGLDVKVCDAEFHLPVPSYTIDTFRYLSREFPQHTFSLLMGADLMKQFSRWKEHGEILARYRIYVYPRKGYRLGGYIGAVTYLADAPVWDYSSTDIRKALRKGKDVGGIVSPGVLAYIKEHGLYEK